MADEKLTPLFLFDDEPVRAHTDDHLALKPFSSMIAAAALGNRGPFNIGVFSGWGQGKTSVLRQARSLIDAQNKPHIVTAWVNAWQYEHEEHPIVPLLAVIINEITKTLDERKTALDKAGEGTGKLLKDLSRALRSIAYGFSAKTDVKIPGFAGLEVGFVAKDMIDRDEKLSADRDPLLDQSLYYHAYDRLEKFREQLEKTSLTDQPRIVVFIDDLDRCQPDKALHLLESLKLVLAQPGFIFVLAVDRRVIDAFLTKRYHDEFGITPDKFHGKQYMDKIIQLPLDLPHHQNRFEKYIEQLIHDPKHDNLIPQEFRHLFSDEKAGPAFISALAAGCSRCPRTLIRTLNYLLTDFFLRKNGFFIEEKDPFGKDHGEFLQFAAVSRITRITFGSEQERLYQKLVAFDQACWQLAHYLNKEDNIWRATSVDPEWGFYYPGGEEDLKETIADYEPFRAAILNSDSLNELFHSVIGLRWLKEHEKRQAIEGYIAIREDPIQGADADSLEMINAAIRGAIDYRGDSLGDEDRAKVTELDFGSTSIKDLTPISRISNLRVLNLNNTQVGDLSPLSSLHSLQVLLLNNTPVSDLTPLSGMNDLHRLHLDHSRVKDLSGLSGLIELKNLLLHGTLVKDMKPLSGLVKLQRLSLRETKITDLSPLVRLSDLNSLLLSNTAVADFRPLARLKSLRRIDLEGTKIKDLSSLTTLTDIRELNLSSTEICDIQLLSGLTELRGLWLKGTPVADLEPLFGLSALLMLWLTGTPAAKNKSSLAALRKALPNCKIIA